MKHLFVTLSLMLLLGTISFAASNKKGVNNDAKVIDTVNVKAKAPFVPNATIYTPTTEIYDDAVDIVQYDGYTLYDDNNTEVLKVRSSIDKSVRLKLQPGDYIVKLDGQETTVYSISVKADWYNKFVIE